jgi:hypothetical protein
MEAQSTVGVRSSDEDTKRVAKRALERDLVGAKNEIELVVCNGWITLRGEVDWQYQRAHAERIVGSVPGVLGVINSLNVRPSEALPIHAARQQHTQPPLTPWKTSSLPDVQRRASRRSG